MVTKENKLFINEFLILYLWGRKTVYDRKNGDCPKKKSGMLKKQSIPVEVTRVKIPVLFLLLNDFQQRTTQILRSGH
jgi:hypothetical protein